MTEGFGRKGRPPRVRELMAGRFVVTVKGTAFRFTRLKSGHLKLLGPVAQGSYEDFQYARNLVGQFVTGNVRAA